jgi:hypothetical protein
MSTLAIVLIVIGAVVLVSIVLGALGARARDRRLAVTWMRHVAEADAALEQARAEDKGWNREAMSIAARAALAESRPGWTFDELLLVLVEDRPGVEEDRAHFVAIHGNDEETRVVLARQDDRWVAESID